jgi:hypothetical protein
VAGHDDGRPAGRPLVDDEVLGTAARESGRASSPDQVRMRIRMMMSSRVPTPMAMS